MPACRPLARSLQGLKHRLLDGKLKQGFFLPAKAAGAWGRRQARDSSCLPTYLIL